LDGCAAAGSLVRELVFAGDPSGIPSPRIIRFMCVSADRLWAEWMLRMGGAVVLDGQRKPITDLADLPVTDFRIHTDRYGAAVGTISSAKERALKTLCDWARESLTADHFDARFAEDGNASDEIKAIKNDIVALLQEEAKGTPCTSEEVHDRRRSPRHHCLSSASVPISFGTIYPPGLCRATEEPRRI
jgi:hypothetical protein